jgi:hypothetical protein
MNVVWGLLLWFGSGVAVFTMVGSVGLWNAFLLLDTRSWKAHLTLWLGCVVVFTVCLLLMPRTIYFGEDGQMTFSDERAISHLID